jgi:2-polyprenyl-6-methoxyphenol hydroxylase-like FAD-dependent oxidoreductase
VLEREAKFKDRVRGENILPWGVAAARRLGILDDLIAAGGRLVPFFNTYFMGMQTQHRPFPATTPSGEAALNIYHPDLQEALLSGASRAGADVSVARAYKASPSRMADGWSPSPKAARRAG